MAIGNVVGGTELCCNEQWRLGTAYSIYKCNFQNEYAKHRAARKMQYLHRGCVHRYTWVCFRSKLKSEWQGGSIWVENMHYFWTVNSRTFQIKTFSSISFFLFLHWPKKKHITLNWSFMDEKKKLMHMLLALFGHMKFHQIQLQTLHQNCFLSLVDMSNRFSYIYFLCSFWFDIETPKWNQQMQHKKLTISIRFEAVGCSHFFQLLADGCDYKRFVSWFHLKS